MTIASKSLTKYPLASLKEVLMLSFSFILVLFAGSLMGLCDRLILSHYSLRSAEAAISGLYLIQLFQIPCIRVTSTAQIFVGQYKGAGEQKMSGPVVWQMIWFSILSMLILLPISWPISRIFFQNSPIQTEGIAYFRYLMSINFLFPLGAALTAFYLGQGHAKKVLIISIASHILHILLDFPLILGIKGILPPFGVKGAAISAGISQFFFCALLFKDFLKPIYRQLYGTAKASFNPSLFRKCLKVAIPRAASKITFLIAWVAVTHIIIHKQENYLAVLAFGGTVNLFYTCFNEGMCQAITTIGSYLVGSKQFLLWKLARSAFTFLMLGAALLAIPCLFFPESMISAFFKEIPSPMLKQELHLTCYWLWLLFITHGCNLIGLGLLNSYGDTPFQMLFAVTLGWMLNYWPVYFWIGKKNAPPNQFWLYMAGACAVSTLIYLLRLQREKWKKNSSKIIDLSINQSKT